MKVIAIIVGMLGSIIGIYSATSVLVGVGGELAQSSRLWAGWSDLILAVPAGIAAAFITTRPRTVGFTMLISGIVGFACINLFQIYTFYLLAIPFWLIAAVVGFISARPTTPGVTKNA